MIPLVKKLLIIFMLLALPLQFSWAAAAIYCQHEQISTSAHFGHHEHQHDASSDYQDNQNDQDDHSSTLKVHTDCGYCHAVSQVSVLTPAALITVPAGFMPAELQPISFSSYISDGPRRPDRQPVV